MHCQLGMPWLLMSSFIKASSNTHWRPTRLKGKIIFGFHTSCFRRKQCSGKTYEGRKTANTMTLKTGAKFHTEIFTSSKRKSVKIIIRVMIETCQNRKQKHVLLNETYCWRYSVWFRGQVYLPVWRKFLGVLLTRMTPAKWLFRDHLVLEPLEI